MMDGILFGSSLNSTPRETFKWAYYAWWAMSVQFGVASTTTAATYCCRTWDETESCFTMFPPEGDDNAEQCHEEGSAHLN